MEGTGTGVTVAARASGNELNGDLGLLPYWLGITPGIVADQATTAIHLIASSGSSYALMYGISAANIDSSWLGNGFCWLICSLPA
jgi:hypothetical protein